MQRLSLSEKITLIVAMAAVGGLLRILPPRLLDQYHQVEDLGPPGLTFISPRSAWRGHFIGLAGGMIFGSFGPPPAAKRPPKRGGSENPQAVPAEKGRRVSRSSPGRTTPSRRRRRRRPQTSAPSPHHRVERKQDSQRLEIVAFGSISSGKSSLLNALAGRDVFQTDLRGGTTLPAAKNAWPGDAQVSLVDTPVWVRWRAKNVSPWPPKPPTTPTPSCWWSTALPR